MARQIVVSAQLTGQEAVVSGWDWATAAGMPQVWISSSRHISFEHTWKCLAPGSFKKCAGFFQVKQQIMKPKKASQRVIAANSTNALTQHFQWKGTLWLTAFCMNHISLVKGKLIKLSLVFFSLSPSYFCIILSHIVKNQEGRKYWKWKRLIWQNRQSFWKFIILLHILKNINFQGNTNRLSVPFELNWT